MCICQPPGLTFTKACDIKTCCAKCTFMVLLAMLESAVYYYDKDNSRKVVMTTMQITISDNSTKPQGTVSDLQN